MLADDEGIVIDSVKFIIEKEFGDECVIEFAKTGRSVIELAETFRPDIAIMDIQMPGINGIDSMKEIRKNNNNVVFIVMSAYDKFDYAKEAIKLGVLEYITKPMEKTKLLDTLKRAMAVVDKEREKRSNDLLIREKLETVIPVLESGLIYEILLHEHFTEDITLEQIAAQSNLSPHYFTRLFGESFRMKLWDHVLIKRIDMAKRLLTSQSDITVLEIALRCGFHNTANFNRAFLRFTGMTPSEYRKGVPLH
jgi:YesN/AraC family two-component response regulator